MNETMCCTEFPAHRSRRNHGIGKGQRKRPAGALHAARAQPIRHAQSCKPSSASMPPALPLSSRSIAPRANRAMTSLSRTLLRMWRRFSAVVGLDKLLVAQQREGFSEFAHAGGNGSAGNRRLISAEIRRNRAANRSSVLKCGTRFSPLARSAASHPPVGALGVRSFTLAYRPQSGILEDPTSKGDFTSWRRT